MKMVVIYTKHTFFTSSGTFEVDSVGSYGNNVEYLVVAGGGSGGGSNAWCFWWCWWTEN